MGVKYEINWYLVVDSEDKIKPYGYLSDYSTVKNEYRIYPLESIIPIVIKSIGCIGMCKIKCINLEENKTHIYFEYAERFSNSSKIGKHYYDMYLKKKNK